MEKARKESDEMNVKMSLFIAARSVNSRRMTHSTTLMSTQKTSSNTPVSLNDARMTNNTRNYAKIIKPGHTFAALTLASTIAVMPA